MTTDLVVHMTPGQVYHMVMHYPIWAWLLFISLLLVATRLWGIIGAVLMYKPISWVVYKLGVKIIGSTGADTADLIFALGYFHRLAILSVVFLLFVVVPTIVWRKKKLNLSVMQALFFFRLRPRAKDHA